MHYFISTNTKMQGGIIMHKIYTLSISTGVKNIAENMYNQKKKKENYLSPRQQD